MLWQINKTAGGGKRARLYNNSGGKGGGRVVRSQGHREMGGADLFRGKLGGGKKKSVRTLGIVAKEKKGQRYPFSHTEGFPQKGEECSKKKTVHFN